MTEKLEQLSIKDIPPPPPGTVFVDDASGTDDSSAGTLERPFQTPAYALYSSPDAPIYVRKSADGQFEPISASMLKKAKKGVDGLVKKIKNAEETAAKKAADDARKLEEAKKIVLVNDSSLPEAKRIKIRDGSKSRESRVVIQGWVHRLRLQKGLAFLVLRDGTGFLQCVLAGDLVSSFLACFLNVTNI